MDLPKDDRIRVKLYEKLLEGSMLGGQMAGGGVGVAVKEELILDALRHRYGLCSPSLLRAFAPLYVETVEKWRTVCRDICEGREPSVDTMPKPPPQHPHQNLDWASAPKLFVLRMHAALNLGH